MPFEGNGVARDGILLLESLTDSQPLTREQRQELLRKLRRLEDLEEETERSGSGPGSSKGNSAA